jgi:hypothetical protein
MADCKVDVESLLDIVCEGVKAMVAEEVWDVVDRFEESSRMEVVYVVKRGRRM